MENGKIKKALFQFKTIQIEESSIKRAPNKSNGKIEIKMEPNGIIFKDEKIFKLTILVTLTEEEVFAATVKAVGIFEFKDVVNKEDLRINFYRNAPAILFPYVRSYIAALTALSGMEAINIPPVNIVPLGDTLEKQTKEE